MGEDIEQRDYSRDVTAVVDSRGRLTIREGDRVALGIEGQRALLDMNVRVLKTLENNEHNESHE